ncbi:transcriptional regulator [Jannaschia pagri]|uniref:Transcriptional regulator n=1 Tax=Jannaschia pagri TaxID=2829797 RepID=A0ABQ4NMX2_9RHOB|nr:MULTISPECIES: LacI family DNA-binding transcriptional regulator [unclassified Jannaschia]GIT91921.1 transcriptional regulator [Jannaschia sp. AI_61]GIT95755.1 transcriptional regulator [Jannaschia sp. AI_62]
MAGTIRKSARRVTAADVAEAAGVSRSAVSRAFTPGSYLDDGKRRAILRAAKRLGYRPNAMAAILQGGASDLVAIFAGEMPNDFDREVAAALVSGLNAIGKWPLVIGGDEATARRALANVLRYPLEAMILRSGSLDEGVAKSCAKLGVPVISSGRILHMPGVDNVCCRNRDGMADMGRLLIEGGRRRVAFVGGPETFWSAGERRLGLVTALHAAGLTLSADAMGAYTVQSGYDAAADLLAGPPFDALVCANDAMAIGALSLLRDRGIPVPEQIAVVGFDDIAMAAWPAFNLTTVRNPIDTLVETVTDLVQRRVETPTKPDETIAIDVSLVCRGTH